MEISVKNSKIFVYLFIVAFVQGVFLAFYGWKLLIALMPIIVILAICTFRPVAPFVFDGQKLQGRNIYGHVRLEFALEQLEVVEKSSQEQILYAKEGNKRKRLISSQSLHLDRKDIQELFKALTSQLKKMEA